MPKPMNTLALTIEGSPLRLTISAREVNPGHRDILKAKMIPKAMHNVPSAPKASQRLREIPGTKRMRKALPMSREVKKSMSLDTKGFSISHACTFGCMIPEGSENQAV